MKSKITIKYHTMLKDYSDAALLDMLHKGNRIEREKIFGVIVNKYSRSLYSYLRRILVNHDDTDDVLQETFIRAWNSIDSIKDGAALKNWLYRIANNTAISLLREKASMMTVSIDDYDVMEETSSIEEMEKMDNVSRLTIQAIHSLPKTQQMVFTMKHFQGLKYNQISEILGTSEGALKASYHIAVEKIKAFVKQKTEI